MSEGRAERLSDVTTRRLMRAPVTAPSVCFDVDLDDASALLPRGFERLHESGPLHRQDFDAAADEVLSWGIQLGAGLSVRASDAPLVEGTVVVLGLGVGPLRLPIPCRVVDVIDEPRRRGFVYATLPGHPECGIERFCVELRDDGVWTSIDAISRPGWFVTRVGSPAMRRVQRWMTRRYLRALAR